MRTVARHEEALSEGVVYACPVCGKVVLYHCYHDGLDVTSVKMTKWDAERLRWESGEYDPMTYICQVCDKERPMEPGVRIGPGYCCPLCADSFQDSERDT